MGEHETKPFRLLPNLEPENEHFWTGGAAGELRFLRCGDCGYYIHPPAPVCPRCLGRDVKPQAVSGKGSVFTYTINHQSWNPSVPTPYAIALVEIDEQPELRVATQIVNCPVEDVHIGMRVRVTFSHEEDVWVPLFEPEP